ncbi:MAG: FlgD immunoglobulin-like domain containing protein [Candidatus Margulisiibacteriota bacterium]
MTENRAASGTVNLPVPMTLKVLSASGEGERKYITSMTLTKPPSRIAGKLNYLVPKLMKKFEYSFNFAAWKSIEGVNPETGEFVLENMPFAEGQNVIAIRAENAVGIKSSQLLKIILNTIPMVPSELSPLPGTFTKNNQPTFKGKFAKSSYSEDPLENVSLTTAKLMVGTEEVDVTGQVKTTVGGGTYDKHMLFEYTPTETLPDGQYSLMVVANSNVGVSQAVMDITIDTRAPTIAMVPIQPYSPRAPATIKFTSSDEASPNLASIRCELFDLNNNLVTTIATSDALSKGDNFFSWDGGINPKSEILNPNKVPDGDYLIKITASDLAGNQAVAKTPITIDSTPPIVAGVDVTPNPMTSKTTEMGLTARTSEKAQVIIKLVNTSKNTTTAYLAQATPNSELSTPNYLASYTWKYDSAFGGFMAGPEDGLYRVEVVARDDAGNESVPRTLEAIRIDRTPPVIYGQLASPYVLANSGANAYKSTISFNLSEDNDVADNRGKGIGPRVKVKLYNSNSGQQVGSPWELTTERSLVFNAADQSIYPKGAYRFQLIAEDDVGNIGLAYASCVKDGIAPVISNPAEDGSEVSGMISLRGTAIDPDWTNDRPFKKYSVYYRKGNTPLPVGDGMSASALAGEGWETSAIEVPLINRGNSSTANNVSLRPLQNEATLAYLNTALLENGQEYTVMVVVDEEGGESLAVTRAIKINNDEMTLASLKMPYAKLKSFPSDVAFKSDDSVKLPIGFINSVKPANVYVEIIKALNPLPLGEGGPSPTATVGEGSSVAFFKYYPNILGAPFIGKPDYKAGTDLGYFIWSDDDGYHLRWSADGNNHKFTGSIVLVGSGSYTDIKQYGGGIKVQSPLISWDTSISGGEGGIDFKIGSGQLMITAKTDDDPANPSIYADNVFLGISKYAQTYLPIMIDVAGQRLVDMTNLGGQPAEAKPANLERATQTVLWDGKFDTGGYVDNGTYIIRLRAEGTDGLGVATDEAIIQVKTPYEFAVKEITPNNREFTTIGLPDRVTIQYSVSKDSIVNALVQKSNGELLATLANGEEVLGVQPNNPHALSWRGNYPDPESGLMAGPGDYKLILNVIAKDGSDSKQYEVNNLKITSFTSDLTKASLAPLGEEVDFNNGVTSQKIRLAEGESPYYVDIKGIGRYFPPKDFNYTLTATGGQKITTYPYVPFAALMHRGFRAVDTKVKVTFKIHAWNHYLGAEDDVVMFGYKVGTWWNPFKWRREREERVETVWLEKDNLPVVGGKGVVFKQGDEAKGYQFEFDTNAWWPWNWDDYNWSKPNPGSGIDAIDTYIEVYAKDGSFVLDNTFSDLLPNTGVARTIKGVFKAENVGTPYSTSHLYNELPKSYGAYRVNLTLQLEAPIAYSRLTNRFVPWIGFVDKLHPANEPVNFSGYLDKLDKLGFPGRDYFVGPTAVTKTAPHLGSYDTTLFPGNTGALASVTGKVDGMDISEPKVAEINNKANSKMSGNATDYTSYLSDEYLEFIPITAPLNGQYEYNGNAVSGVLSLTQQSSYPFMAKTELIYAANTSDHPSPFAFSWPLSESEISTFNTEQTNRRKILDKEQGGDPQKYTGTSADGTWWELDPAELAQRRLSLNNVNTKTLAAQVRYDQGERASVWKSGTSNAGQLLSLPGDFTVLNPKYSIIGNTSGISVRLTADSPLGAVEAEDNDKQGLAWTTGDDLNLIGQDGLVRSSLLAFNDKEFLGTRTHKIADHYAINQNDYRSAAALKYTFLKRNPYIDDGISPVDNPNLVISNWQVSVKDRANTNNQDITVKQITSNSRRLDDTFALKLKLNAAEARYIEITGAAPGAYELMYFDGKSWARIQESLDNKPVSGRLAWWNVSRLNGKYTVLLKSGGLVATTDINIGTLVRKDETKSAWSAYKRAELHFPSGAFVNGSKLVQDQLVTITPVTMTELKIRNRPILLTHGPIVEIKPSPWKFAVSTLEGIDRRPSLKFVYTFDDLVELGVDVSKIATGTGKVQKDLMLPWNIHQVTAAGDLQIVSDNYQEIQENNGEKQYVFWAALDHFSTYALLNGKFSLSAPMIFADRYITNKDTVTVYGTAEPESIVTLYVKTENIVPDAEKGESYQARMTAEKGTGNFRFENVSLPQEGNNYIYVTSHQESDKNVRTFSDVTVVKDTVPPSVEASQNLYAFSPNGDGKYDSVDYALKTNENGKIYLSVMSNANGVTRTLLNQEISAEANKEVKLTWTKESFLIYRRDNMTGQWILFSEIPISERLADGEYNTTVYAIDEAGNIANNVISQTIVDTTPPAVLGLNADPNPFTPNDDGVKDTTKFWYKFSEPAYTTLNIYRDDGKQFRNHEGATENFSYPTTNKEPRLQSQVPSSGQWEWDGRGSRNELLGGTYSWEVYAEDWVGNSTTSEIKAVVVDRVPTLIPYAFAEPDPFAPVSPNNSYTEIKYYLARDNLKLSVSVLGGENKAIKTLVNNEVQGKGEHTARWYGDFDGDYAGSTASANKYRVGDGSYEFRVYAADPDGGQPADVTNTVLVDNIPPYISIKPVEVDYAKKTAKLNYNLPENASVEAGVYDAEGNLIERLVTGEAKTPGDYSLAYALDPLAQAPFRYFKIVARDRARNEAERTSETFSVAPNQFGVTSQVIPATFTPNGDSLNDQTRVSYNISGGVGPYTVSINIVNGVGATVKRLVENESQSAGTWSFYWDGKTDGGQLTADGNYECVITAKDKLNTIHESRSTILVVSTRPTVDLSTSLPIFSPNGDNSKDKVTFNYSINYPTFYITGEALVKLEVLNSTGEAVWSKTFNHTAGSYVYEYDGAGLPAGNYYVKISGEDALGTTAIPKTVNLQVDYAKPIVSIQPISPNPFSPYVNGVKDQTVISYTLAKSAYITIKVKQGDTVVRTLRNNQWTEAYLAFGNRDVQSQVSKNIRTFAIPTLTWDGKDETNSFVADGNYSIEISALDPAGNSHLVSQEVGVDNTVPAVPVVGLLPANTNETMSIVAGTAESNSQVKVYINDNLVSSGTASVEGNFSIPTTLVVGVNTLKLDATDAAGNTSAASTSQAVIYETDAPIISSLSVSPNPAKAGTLTLTFTVSETLESDPIVKINTETATFSRRFPASTDLNYEYIYNVTSSDQQGAAAITIAATDLANNLTTHQANNLLTIDTIQTTVSNIDLDVEGNPRGSSPTTYAKLGSKVKVDFSVSEPLLADPVVHVGTGFIPVQESKTIYSSSRVDYSYSYTIASSDADGTTPVSIEVTDLAGNLTLAPCPLTLMVDKGSPTIEAIAVSRDPANEGSVDITFSVTDSPGGLINNPTIEVTQNNYTTFKYLASLISGGTYRTTYTIPADSSYDGTASIVVKTTDKALNYSSASRTFEVDTKDPTFGQVSSIVSSNNDYQKQAKAGATIVISFEASETLRANPAPQVKINSNFAAPIDQAGNYYTYEYTILPTDDNGPATLLMYGYDLAGNYGEDTASALESFVIDLVTPEVTKVVNPGDNADMIATPAHFATNSDPNDIYEINGGIPRSTTLHYKVSEDSKVTLSIHRIANTDNTTVYKKEDFNDANKIVSFDMGWQTGGVEQTKMWNGYLGSDQYAEPGKYAFIVKARDAAGNITEIKYGGTFWIQDNVLKLIPPDQLLTSNPDPLFISPFGNSDNPVQKRARLYFRINLGITPATVWPAQWLKAMAVDIDWSKYLSLMKKVGTYRVKVYNEAGTLVWTSPAKEAYSAKNEWLDWGGSDEAGVKVPDGKYRMVAEIKDFRGQPVYENTLGDKWVTVDNEKPTLPSLSAVPYSFSPLPGTNSVINLTTLTYEVSDNNSQAKIEIKVNKAGLPVVALTEEAWQSNGIYTRIWNGNGQTGPVGTGNAGGFTDGTYTFKISAVDQAGNSASGNIDVIVDTVGPSYSQIKTDNGWATPGSWSNDTQQAYIIFSATDEVSGVDRTAGFIDGANQGTITSPWRPTFPEGTYTMYLKTYDKAGVYIDSGPFTYLIDTIKPYFTQIKVDNGWATPGSWSRDTDQAYITFAAADATSGLASVEGFVDGVSKGTVTTPWRPTLPQGTRTVFLRAHDVAKNYFDSQAYTYYIDTVAPYFSAINPNNGWASPNVWSSDTSAYITFTAADATSDVDRVEGIIDGASQGTITTPWRPDMSNGTHPLVLRIHDIAGNTSDTAYTYMIDNLAPYLSISGPSPTFNPYVDGSVTVSFNHYDLGSSDLASRTARIKYGSNTVKDLTIDGSGDIRSVTWDGKNNSGDYENEGDYTLEITITDNAGNSITKTSTIYLRDDQYGGAPLFGTVNPYLAYDGKLYLRFVNGDKDGPIIYSGNYRQYEKAIPADYAVNFTGTPVTGPLLVSTHKTGPAKVTVNGVSHEVWNEGSALYYKRGSSEKIKIASCSVFVGSKAICVDKNDNNAYIAWAGYMSGSPPGGGVYLAIPSIQFQKIPVNFAPVNGTNVGPMSVIAGEINVALSAPLLPPTLIAPADKKANVQSIRPTFEWKHQRSNQLTVTSYQLDVAKNDAFSIAKQSFNKSANSGSPDKTDSTLYYYTYSIHEFDPGLEKDTYFWKVTALSTSEAATSEVWSFTIQPDLTLTGITNYPNPFSPNRETTKIRYKLGADADEVKIRIYDITGSLVIEKDGTTNGEASSIWSKYNDIEWDGRNGRGDLVMNGIYPYEVVARLGDRSVSGRGKIAVLK